MNCMIYSASHSFSTICSISTWLNNFSSISAFLQHACHANPGANKK